MPFIEFLLRFSCGPSFFSALPGVFGSNYIFFCHRFLANFFSLCYWYNHHLDFVSHRFFFVANPKEIWFWVDKKMQYVYRINLNCFTFSIDDGNGWMDWSNSNNKKNETWRRVSAHKTFFPKYFLICHSAQAKSNNITAKIWVWKNVFFFFSFVVWGPVCIHEIHADSRHTIQRRCLKMYVNSTNQKPHNPESSFEQERASKKKNTLTASNVFVQCSFFLWLEC